MKLHDIDLETGQPLMVGDDWPAVLRLRGREGDPRAVTELSLGGHDLLQYFPTSVEIRASAQCLTTATITFDVRPDVEIPVELRPPATDTDASLATS